MSIIPIFIPHAGCPHQCIFCNQKTISGTKNVGAGYAEKQIKQYLQWISPSTENEAAFYGGTFTALPFSLQKELLALTDNLIEKKIIGSVRLSTRPDYIYEEELLFLKKHGVKLIELGVQSLDDTVLSISERGHSKEDVKKAMNLLKKHEFKTGLQLMTGMPGQDFASVKETIKEACALKPDIARIYPLLVVKNTKLETMYENREFTPLSLEEATRQAAYMYEKLTENGCLVIRTGLQADEELCSDGNILAGPFHPSMGELVKSRIIRNRVEKVLDLFIEESAALNSTINKINLNEVNLNEVNKNPEYTDTAINKHAENIKNHTNLSAEKDENISEKLLLKEYLIKLPVVKSNKDITSPKDITSQKDATNKKDRLSKKNTTAKDEVLKLLIFNASAKKSLFRQFKTENCSLLTLFPGSENCRLKVQLLCPASMSSKIRGLKNCNTKFWQEKLKRKFSSDKTNTQKKT